MPSPFEVIDGRAKDLSCGGGHVRAGIELLVMLRREKIRPETVERFKAWEHSGFTVGWERKLEAHDRKGLEGLLSYMERPAVSLRRLQYREDGMVHYQGTRVHPRLGIDHQLVTPVEFLALLVPHVLLRFECVIRSYGAAFTTIRRKFGWIAKDEGKEAPAVPVIEGEESEFVRVRRRNWARLIRKAWLEDPEVCPKCGEKMKVLSAISSPAQDAVLEKILRARGEWDPPWLRSRHPRGPPPLNGRGPGRSPAGETRIEYEEGFDPREDWEVDPDREIGSEGP